MIAASPRAGKIDHGDTECTEKNIAGAPSARIQERAFSPYLDLDALGALVVSLSARRRPSPGYGEQRSPPRHQDTKENEFPLRALRVSVVNLSFCRREARRRRAGIALVLLLALALPVAGCGKRAEPAPPADEKPTYPRIYPHE